MINYYVIKLFLKKFFILDRLSYQPFELQQFL